MRPRRIWYSVTAVAVAAAIGGAALLALSRGGQDTPARAGGPAPVSTAARERHSSPVAEADLPVVNVQPYTIPADQLPGWLAKASDIERPLIADGVLTFDEYSSAVMATVACIEDAGIDVVHPGGYGRGGDFQPGPGLSSRGIYRYTGAITTYSPTRPTGAFDKINDCKTISAQAEFLWAQHTTPSQVEIQAMNDDMATCLRASGAEIAAEHPSDAQLQAVLSSNTVSKDQYRACQFAAADRYEIDRLPG